MGCCQSDSAEPMTDRLLGGDAPPPAAGLARPHGQAQWASYQHEGRPGVAVQGGGGPADNKMSFLVPPAAAVAICSARGHSQHSQGNLKAGVGNAVACAPGAPASLQLPLRIAGHDPPGALADKGGGSPRGRRRAHTAMSYFEPECIICLEPFDKSNPRVKSKCRCGTYNTANGMHLSCLLAWIEQQGGDQICPVCRGRIDFDESE